VQQTGPGVVFNFDNADIYEVIRVIGEILKISYLVDPKVKGVVNIHTSGQIPTEDVFNIFQGILKLNGATAVKKDNLYEIVPMTDAKKLYTTPSTVREEGKKLPEERYTIQIIALKYIPVTEVSKMIKPFLSDGADIVEHPPSNILIIGDVASNVKKSLDIINLFDIDIFTDLRVRIYPILNADVTEVAKEMERIFTSFEVSIKSGRGVGITFTPVVRINSLLVVSSIPNIFEKVEGWLKELDKIPAEGSKFGVFVYYVQNVKAKDLGDVLKDIFGKGREKKEKEKAAAPAEAAQRGVRPLPTTTTPAPSAKEEGGPGGTVPEGEINIVVDDTTNSLIIKAFQRDYRNILETIKKLDIYPKQVLIDILMAEITLDDSYKFGVEWGRIITSNPPNAQSFVLSSLPPRDTTTGQFNPLDQALAQGTNFRYTIVALGGKVIAALNAAASDNRLKVISSPQLLASNNKEAKMQVGSSQPILTSTYSYGSASSTGTPISSTVAPATGTIEGSIEYKDIGIMLTITPRISDGGLITLEIQIEKSDVGQTALGNLTNVPFFPKKTAKTILSVLEGQTIVIGGLIEETKNVVKTGFPLLSKIPVIGALFGYQTYEKKKTEMILIMTPHIIADQSQSKAVTEEFTEKVQGLKKQFQQLEKKE
jgi:general secretion pathway protein D